MWKRCENVRQHSLAQVAIYSSEGNVSSPVLFEGCGNDEVLPQLPSASYFCQDQVAFLPKAAACLPPTGTGIITDIVCILMSECVQCQVLAVTPPNLQNRNQRAGCSSSRFNLSERNFAKTKGGPSISDPWPFSFADWV